MSGASAGEPQRPGHLEAHPNTVPREARRFQGMRAGIVSRTLACAIDFGVVALATLGSHLGVAGLRFLWKPATFEFTSPPFLLLPAVGAVFMVVYLALSWWSTGRTYGDYVFGLRVVTNRRKRMNLGGALIRAVACTFFPIGLMWVAVSPQNRSVQDVVLRTSVIYDWEKRPAR